MKKQLILSIFIFKVISIYADIAPNPIDLKSIMPNKDCMVQMVSESVNALIYKDSSIVECTFNMKNWGNTSNIEVGFPVMTFYHWSTKDTYGDDISPFFDVYVGSNKIDKKSLYIPQGAKELQERVNQGKDYRQKTFKAYRDSLSLIYPKNSLDFRSALNRLVDNFNNTDNTYRDVEPASMNFLLNKKNIPFYVWNVNFIASETITIKVTYKVPCGMKYKDSARYFYYILSTGAGWYKSIEKAIIHVRIMDFDINTIVKSTPTNFQIDLSTNEYMWEFENIEPTKKDNVYLEYVVKKIQP